MANKRKKDLVNKIIIALVIATAIFGYRYWDKTLRDKLIPRRFAAVEEGVLYRSGCIDDRLIRNVLKKHNIQLIVSLMGQYPVEEQAAKDLGIELKQYRLDGDGRGDITVYADALEDVMRAKEQNKPALIHCVSGTMRSGAFTEFYRIIFEGQRDSKKIIRELKKYNWKTDQTDLPEYMNRNMYKLTSMLKERGVLDEIPDPLPQIEFKGVKTYTLEELKKLDSEETQIIEQTTEGQ